MNPQWLVSGIFLALFLVIVVVAQWMHKAGISSEVSRKFVHVGGGVLALFLPAFIDLHWYVLGLCAMAFLFLLTTWVRKELPAIHKTKRKSIGSILFPIPIYICFAAYCYYDDEILFYIPVSLLTFSDTLAEIGGKKFGRYGPTFFGGRKTLIGSLFFFASAAVITAIFGMGSSEILFLAGLVTVVELISLNGWDNVTVPLASLGLLIAQI